MIITILIILIITTTTVILSIYYFLYRTFRDKTLPYDYANFSTFLNHYEKYRYSVKQNYDSIYIFPILNLSIEEIRFPEGSMILYPLSYFRYCLWLKRQLRSDVRIRGLWNE